MSRASRVAFGVVGVVLASGCHAATQRIQEPRVDLDLSPSSGNRGYIVGTPPAADEHATTCEMIQTTLEIPTRYRAKSHGGVATIVTTGPEPEGTTQFTDEAAAAPVGPMDTYVVQKGDSLWKIAAKKEIYGDASKWRRIFDANRDQLKAPDRVRAGMTLNIPRSQSPTQAPLSGKDEQTSFSK